MVVVVGIGLCLGVSPVEMLGLLSEAPVSQQVAAPGPGDVHDQVGDFVSVVLADTEDAWNRKMQGYREPSLVLFDGVVHSACGRQTSRTGPFYCPGDEQVYLDTSFFRELDRRLGAPGDFAAAYVIAHEVGHHVQHLEGTMRAVSDRRRGMSSAQSNRLSVAVELQADCYAGIWANHAARQGNFLEAGDIEEGLGAAAAIGDDRLQQNARGYAVPESFTHGTSEQRMRWFRRGLESGDPAACDTFGAMASL